MTARRLESPCLVRSGMNSSLVLAGQLLRRDLARGSRGILGLELGINLVCLGRLAAGLIERGELQLRCARRHGRGRMVDQVLIELDRLTGLTMLCQQVGQREASQ